VLPATPGLVDEARSKALIEQVGIRTPRNRVLKVAGGLADLSDLARPLVMKGLSDKIAHKSEYGLVALALSKDAEIEEAWIRISAALVKADPQADSILVEEMIGSGLEAILGVQRDDTVGPVVVMGAGGILVELLDDAVILVPPFTLAEAKAAIGRTKFGKLLSGYRGRYFDVDALADAAATLGDIALANPTLQSLDVNPVLVQPQGQGVIAVDAQVVIGD
jgi:succinyl-CoA synthetase beta subunit